MSLYECYFSAYVTAADHDEASAKLAGVGEQLRRAAPSGRVTLRLRGDFEPDYTLEGDRLPMLTGAVTVLVDSDDDGEAASHAAEEYATRACAGSDVELVFDGGYSTTLDPPPETHPDLWIREENAR